RSLSPLDLRNSRRPTNVGSAAGLRYSAAHRSRTTSVSDIGARDVRSAQSEYQSVRSRNIHRPRRSVSPLTRRDATEGALRDSSGRKLQQWPSKIDFAIE